MNEISDTSFLIDPEKPTISTAKKKVRFSPTVTVYKDPTPVNPNDGLGTFMPQPILIPLHEIVEKRNKFSMRTQMDQPIQCSFAAIFILFVFLLFFTVIVWLVIQKLLLIEIESQTASNTDTFFS